MTWDPSDTKNKHEKWWNDRVQAHMMKHQEDPLPIPLDDPGERAYECHITFNFDSLLQSPKLRRSSTTSFPGILR